MRWHAASACACLIGLGSGTLAWATAEQFPGGWCVFKLNGQDPSSPSDYTFDHTFGILTIKNDGFWQILYQDTSVFGDPNAGPVDIPGLTSTYSQGGSSVSIDLRGRHVLGDIQPNGVNANNDRTFRLILQDGGSVYADIWAGTYYVVNSTIPGSVSAAAHIQFKGVQDVASGTELDIYGHLNGWLDILNDIGTSSLNSKIRIRQDVTASGKIDVGGILYGTIDIDGDVLNGTGNYIRMRQMDGGHFECNNLDLQVSNGGDWLVIGHGDPFDPTLVHSGTIEVKGTLSGRIYSRGACALDITVDTIDAGTDGSQGYGGIMSAVGYRSSSSITVTDAFPRGAISYPSAVVPGYSMPLNGAITIASDLGAQDQVAEITTANPDTQGGERAIPIGALIRINGSLRGTSQNNRPAIKATGYLNGKILIDESLIDGSGTGPEVEIAGSMYSNAAITVDYDGWDRWDDWQAGATIKVGATTYTENSGAVNDLNTSPNLWHVTECKADMNNDAAVNGFDIDWFVLAIQGPDGYEAAFPGLGEYDEGSGWLANVLFHGDLDCDGLLNGFDIDPFVERLQQDPECCSALCGEDCPGQGEGGAGLGDPQDAADLLLAFVAPKRLPTAITAIDDLLTLYGDSDRGQYWSAVRDLLEG
ncbi:MAG: hypothetical protein KKB50_10855 [Planctomycetes bacterium]|nr:hypothetical protein [Planctomycetota bacterium]